MNIVIDGKPIVADEGATVLQAARAAGIDIPTLCYREGAEPRTSCFLCVVAIEGMGSLQPSCAAKVREGMVVTTNSDEIIEARKTALELLFSDHAGGCVAPCAMTCPAHIDIPGFIDELRCGRPREAVAILRRSIPFPSVLGRVCGATCESPCVRKRVDESVSIRALHRYAGDVDLASDAPYDPEKQTETGKRVAIIGAGPAGLTAAYYLLQAGHEVVVFDQASEPGGAMRIMLELEDDDSLDGEIAAIERLGMEFRSGWTLTDSASLVELRVAHDAVLIAIGAAPGEDGKRVADFDLISRIGLKASRKGVAIDTKTFGTGESGVFAAGDIVLGGAYNPVRAVAAGRLASVAIDQFLRDEEVVGESRALNFWRNPEDDELATMREEKESPGCSDVDVMTDEQAVTESSCCLQCSCAARDNCKLRDYGQAYGVNTNRFRGERRHVAPDRSNAVIVYDPGKCVLCGLCVDIAREAGEERGVAFAGRGFTTRVTVPLGGDFDSGLARVAARCAEACPTAALSLKRR